MFYVMTPIQMSTSMFRFASYAWENQLKLMKVFNDMAKASTPMMLSREAILKRATPAEEPAIAKPAPRRTVDAVEPAATPKAAPKPRASAAKPKAAAKPAPEALTAAPEAPTAEPRKYRAPATPPAMPESKATE